MKVGDLVREKKRRYSDRRPMWGIVVGFDCQDDPYVRDMRGTVEAHWTHKLEVVGKYNGKK